MTKSKSKKNRIQPHNKTKSEEPFNMIPVSPTRLFATDRYPNKHLDKRPHFVWTSVHTSSGQASTL
ncbi:unnamed protein product, partial [Brassica oleracea]